MHGVKGIHFRSMEDVYRKRFHGGLFSWSKSGLVDWVVHFWRLGWRKIPNLFLPTRTGVSIKTH